MTALSFHNHLGPGVIALTSDRSLDFSLPDRPPALTEAHEEYLAAALRFLPERIMHIRQVHGNVCLTAPEGVGEPWPEADALVTSSPKVVLTVRTADCLPVFLFDPVQKIAGLVHAGWRGTEAGVTAKTVEAMKRLGSRPEDLRAAFGPGIRPCCYRMDLPFLNRAQLTEAGVLPAHIQETSACTCCDSRFFSYRRDKEGAGRHLSLIVWTPPQGVAGPP